MPLVTKLYGSSIMKSVTRRPYPDLATWRKAMGISQEQAANLLSMSQAFYSRLERRTVAARGPRAKRITEQTGVPLEVLVGAA